MVRSEHTIVRNITGLKELGDQYEKTTDRTARSENTIVRNITGLKKLGNQYEKTTDREIRRESTTAHNIGAVCRYSLGISREGTV